MTDVRKNGRTDGQSSEYMLSLRGAYKYFGQTNSVWNLAIQADDKLGLFFITLLYLVTDILCLVIL